MIRLLKVTMADDVVDYVAPVLRSGFIGEGEQVLQFEAEIARFIGVEPWQVITVNSGTSALLLAMRLAGVEQGSRVFSTPMTCSATNHAIVSLGASPVWCDVDRSSGDMSAESLLSKVKGLRSDLSKAVMAVHWGGYPCESVSLGNICQKYNLSYIEDACQAFGAKIDGRYIGNNTADFTCFSFQAIKNLTTGDGGAVIVRNEEYAKRGRLLRWFGLNRTGSTKLRCLQDPKEFGYKWQMNNIAAAIGLANIKQISLTLDRMATIAKRYDDAFCGNSTVTPSFREPHRESSNWLYTVLTGDSTGFIDFMAKNDIETCRVHTRNDDKTVFRKFACYLPGVTYFDSYHVCIPIGTWLTDADVDKIISDVKRYDKGER